MEAKRIIGLDFTTRLSHVPHVAISSDSVWETKPMRVGRGRWSARRKVSVVLELLRGADLESVSRRHGVTAATLFTWRDEFLASGEACLKRRETHVDDEETQRLKRVVAEQAVTSELLREKIRHLEASGPLGWWRSKR
jgi:transposase-like protein